MFDFKIGGIERRPAAIEGITAIPANRTLLAQKLTQQDPTEAKIVYGLSTIEAVFDHFRPAVDVYMETLDGLPNKETIRFRGLADFGIKELIGQSPSLCSLDVQYRAYTQISRRLQGNRTLQSALGNPDAKSSSVDAAPVTRAPDPTLLADGGYALIESILDGAVSLSPTRKRYLHDPEKVTERTILAENIDHWTDLLRAYDDPAEIIRFANQKAASAEKLLLQNLLTTLEATHELETSYRALSVFYTNTKAEKLANVSVVNAGFEQLTDLDNTHFIDCISDELKQNYDRLDLSRNYSILVVPGFMKSNAVLEKWAKIAHATKVTLFTDFADLDSPDEVIDQFSNVNLSGADLFRANVIMTCNWLVGRSKVAEVGETDHVFIPPSAALAGKVYYTRLSQVSAGKNHGGIHEVLGVRFPLRRNELLAIERLNLVPMIDEFGLIMAFGSKTLFNGDNIGLQTYPVVRVFDYIVKVLVDFLNRRAFENWNSLIEADLRRQIAAFLDSVKGTDKLLDQFRIVRLERDSKAKDRIYLDIRLTPYFPARSFVIQLDGQRPESGKNPEWASAYVLADKP